MILKERLEGSWKSYKTLVHGKVKISCPSNYQEFHFKNDGKVLLENTRDGYSSAASSNRTWCLKTASDADGNKQTYLVLNNKLQYQIVSLNKDVLVIKTLLGIIYFAREAKWQELTASVVN
ncbi:hypothetical protein D770_12120 [Flammeovirgaceae bacterium 311]|nr:hypothetical protein D770_12120 [Flammeovirgaceae bacterium 311]